MKLSFFFMQFFLVLFLMGEIPVFNEEGYACSNGYDISSDSKNGSDNDGMIKGNLYSVEKNTEESLNFTVFLENLSERSQKVFLVYFEKGTRCEYEYIHLQALIGNKWKTVGDRYQFLTNSPFLIPSKEKMRIDFTIHFTTEFRNFPLRLVIGGHDKWDTDAWHGIIYLEFSYKDVPIMRK